MNGNNRRKNRVIRGIVLIALLGMLAVVAPPTRVFTSPAHAAGDDGSALVGKSAPDFTLPDQNDKPVKLSDSRGKWVVLAFYPADMSRGCTFENRSYTTHLGDFKSRNAVVYTVSTQDTASKKEFCSRDGLKHTLLADVGGKVAKEYGALMEGTTYASRCTYYINPEGVVAFLDTKISVGTAAEDSLAVLDRLIKEKK